jgi:small subunit ribosomal protein S6
LTAYEILLLLDPELAEERQSEIVTRVRELAEKGGGTWVSHDTWGRRRLAYEIDKKGEGVYHLLNVDAEPATLDEISRILKITDGVMRHLAVHRIEGRGTGYRPDPESAPAASAPDTPAPSYDAPDASAGSDDSDGAREYAGQTDSPAEEE